MIRLLLSICLMGSVSLVSSVQPHPLKLTGSALNNSTRTLSAPDVKLLIRRLRKGRLGGGGLALLTQLDQQSMSTEGELKEKLELVDAPGLKIQTDYAFNLNAPMFEPSKGTWIHNPRDFEFALIWTSHYQEVFGGQEGHIRVMVNETFVAYRVSRPVAVKKWLCSYALDREVDKDKEEEFRRLNETVVAPARTKILQEIRAFIDTNTTGRKRK